MPDVVLMDVRMPRPDGIEVGTRGEAVLAPALTRRLIERFVSVPPPSSTTPIALSGLSARELEVFEQLAYGRSNSEVAAALFLGIRR